MEFCRFAKVQALAEFDDFCNAGDPDAVRDEVRVAGMDQRAAKIIFTRRDRILDLVIGGEINAASARPLRIGLHVIAECGIEPSLQRG